MKKKIYSTFLLCMMMVAAMAQTHLVTSLNRIQSAALLLPSKTSSLQTGKLAENEEYVSYCQNPAPFLRMQTETYDMASYYDAMLVEKYVGNKINKVRVYMGGEVKALTIWLREKLNEKPVFSKEISSDKLSGAGWIEVELPANQAYTIKKGGYYVGYTITQKKVNADDKTYYPLAASAEGTLMKNTFMCSEDGGKSWIDYTSAYYAQYEYILVLGTQTAIASDKHVNKDLSLSYFEGESRVIKRNTQTGKSKINYYGYLFNSGKELIKSFDLEVSAPGVQPTSTTVKLGGNGLPAYRGVMLKGTIEVPNDAAIQLNFKANNINEGTFTDEYTANNETATENIHFFDESSVKTSLIEMYTTVPCPNCPKGHKVIEALPTDCNKIVVAHHVGYDTDQYTLEGSNDYMYEFGIKGAPYATINRTYLINNGGTAFSIGYPNPSQGASEVVESMVESEAIVPAFANIRVVLAYNKNTRELTVTVSGEKTYPELYDVIMKKSCVNVFITENEIIGKQSGVSGNYTHNHVLRAILGGAWGTEVTWNSDNYTAEFHTTIDESWNTDNLSIVAFLSDEDPDNSYYHNVMNAAEVNLDGTSAINETAMDNLKVSFEEGNILIEGDYDSYCIYNMQGVQVKNESLKRGIYLVKVETVKESAICKIAVK